MWVKHVIRRDMVNSKKADLRGTTMVHNGSGDPLGRIGTEIKHLRRSRGLKLTELAARIGRSVGFMSQVERGLSRPSLKDLYAISVHLGVQVSWFLDESTPAPDRERGVIVRAGARRSYEQGGVSTQSLSPQLGEEIEMMISTLRPGSTTGERPAAHRGREAGMILRGTLELTVAGETFLLEEGDSYTYLTTETHSSRNTGDTDAVVLWVTSPLDDS
jgi:transcriptional regulator with XRE-family HTH domain